MSEKLSHKSDIEAHFMDKVVGCLGLAIVPTCQVSSSLVKIHPQ